MLCFLSLLFYSELLCQPNDYALQPMSGIKYKFNEGSIIIFHNPQYFFQENESNAQDLDVYYQNITSIIVIAKENFENVTLFFTVWKIPSDCDTFDVYVGSSAYFNILATNDLGNITMERNQKICLILTSPHIVSYTFYIKDTSTEKSCIEVKTYSDDVKSFNEGFFNKICKSVFMKWISTSDESDAINGGVGLCLTRIVTPNDFSNYKYVEELLPLQTSYINSSYCGLLAAPDYASMNESWLAGEYQITIPSEDMVNLNFSKFTLVAFHNPSLFECEAHIGTWMLNILSDTKYVAVNFTMPGFISIKAKSVPRKCYFTVFNYSGFQCSTFDLYVGVSPKLGIGSIGNANMTMLGGEINCFYFSSPLDISYLYRVDGIDNSVLETYHPLRINDAKLTQTGNKTTKRRSLFMRWVAKNTVGSASLKKNETVGDLRENFLDTLIKGSVSYTEQEYSLYDASDDYKIYQGPSYQSTNGSKQKSSNKVVIIVLFSVFGGVILIIIVSCFIIERKRRKNRIEGDETSCSSSDNRSKDGPGNTQDMRYFAQVNANLNREDAPQYPKSILPADCSEVYCNEQAAGNNNPYVIVN